MFLELISVSVEVHENILFSEADYLNRENSSVRASEVNQPGKENA